jgi:hypothetical protein
MLFRVLVGRQPFLPVLRFSSLLIVLICLLVFFAVSVFENRSLHSAVIWYPSTWVSCTMGMYYTMSIPILSTREVWVYRVSLR